MTKRYQFEINVFHPETKDAPVRYFNGFRGGHNGDIIFLDDDNRPVKVMDKGPEAMIDEQARRADIYGWDWERIIVTNHNREVIAERVR